MKARDLSGRRQGDVMPKPTIKHVIPRTAPPARPVSLPAKNTVVLDDLRVLALLSDPRIRTAFPELTSIAQTLQQETNLCGRCEKARGKAKRKALLATKKFFGQLPAEGQTSLKTLLGAEHYLIYLPADRGVERREF